LEIILAALCDFIILDNVSSRKTCYNHTCRRKCCERIEALNMFRVKKSLNNNVLIALDGQEKEVVLIGNGIGFHYKKKDIVDAQKVEKMFVLRDQQEQQQYKQFNPKCG
jgi:transcriptional antiterminator